MKRENLERVEESAAPPKPRRKRNHESPILEVLADGTLVHMTKKAAAKWRKSIKSKIRDVEVSDAE